MAVLNALSGKSESREGRASTNVENYDYGANWDSFPEQVRTYSLRPLPKALCRTRLCYLKEDGRITTDTYTNYYGFGVVNGMENVKLLTIGHVSMCILLSVRPSLYMFKKKLEAGDVLLEMNGEPLCGSGSCLPYYIMKMQWDKREILTIKLISRKLLKNCIDVSQFLHDSVFSKSSLHYQIQLNIRTNLYALSAPITNRPKRNDDVPPEHGGYLFVDNARLYYWFGRQFFVEAGEYEGYFYGSVWPNRREVLVSGEDENIFMPELPTDEFFFLPFRGRRTSFKKAVGMIPKDSKGELAELDLIPRCSRSSFAAGIKPHGGGE